MELEYSTNLFFNKSHEELNDVIQTCHTLSDSLVCHIVKRGTNQRLEKHLHLFDIWLAVHHSITLFYYQLDTQISCSSTQFT